MLIRTMALATDVGRAGHFRIPGGLSEDRDGGLIPVGVGSLVLPAWADRLV